MISITVHSRAYDTPVFKTPYAFSGAKPAQNFRLNLLKFIEQPLGLSPNNPVRFRIIQKPGNPAWLSIDTKNQTLLHGRPGIDDAGLIKEITLVATTNTGGDSLPMTLQIPIAYDIDPNRTPS